MEQHDTQAVIRHSLPAQVTDFILNIISEQRLTPGDTLPSTGDLATRFGVSRTVIREALAALEGRGIVERSQGRESVVASPGPEQLQEFLSFRIRGDEIPMSAVVDLRIPLEVQSATLAARHASAEQAAELRAAWERLAQAATDSDFQQADLEFHDTLAKVSGNPLIVLVLQALSDVLRDFRRRTFRTHKRSGRTTEEVIEQHRQILVAVETGDVEGAAAAMTQHLLASAQLVASSGKSDVARDAIA